MSNDLQTQLAASESLTAKFPGATITEAVQPVSSEDFRLQKEKHLSRNAEGGAIGILETPDNRIVLTKRSGMHAGWSLPGGTVETGEDFQEAYEREIFEEIGVKAQNTRLMLLEKKEFVSPENEKLHFLLAVFVSSISETTLPPKTPDAIAEGLDVEFFKPTDLPEKMILGDKAKVDFYVQKFCLG